MAIETMREKINHIWSENDLSHDYVITDEGIVAVIVEWGDWKHDHAYLDYIMEKNGFDVIGEKVTDECGCDCYSSCHFYLHRKQ